MGEDTGHRQSSRFVSRKNSLESQGHFELSGACKTFETRRKGTFLMFVEAGLSVLPSVLLASKKCLSPSNSEENNL